MPLEESLGTLVELRDDGKIRHIGLSGASPKMLELAAAKNSFALDIRPAVTTASQSRCPAIRISSLPEVYPSGATAC